MKVKGVDNSFPATLMMKLLYFLLIAIIVSPLTTRSQPIIPKVNIVNNYSQINSIPSLLKTFIGKPIFVDLWASWCDPCKEEFKFSAVLYQELTKRGVVIVYVSIDKDPQDSIWKSDISKFKLNGYHVKANKALRDELTTLIWGGVDAFSIPHYIMFDSNGVLVSKDMMAPGTASKLYKQIDELIKL